MRDQILDALTATYRGRKWLLTSDALAGLSGTVADLEALGATDVFCVANQEGTGDKPEAPYALAGGQKAASIMEGIRQTLGVLGNVPDDVRQQVDAWDPDGTALCIGPIWDDGAPVAGRRKFARRRPEWQALEDKMLVDAFWDEAGVERAPCRVVPVDEARAASSDLDWGQGVVWVGDNREGWHGGAEYLRWVRGDVDAEAAQTFLSAHCDRVRVMPFLDGVPCSIHGVVMDNGVVAVRPCEMIVLRRPGQSTLHYARAGTFWDPPPADRAVMVQAVRDAGALLRRQVGYRGVFTIDGVMTREGFLPTELNPRFGGALATVARGTELPLLLLHHAIVDGLELPAAQLESWLVEAADTQRSASGMAMVHKPVGPQEASLVLVGNDPSNPDSWTFSRPAMNPGGHTPAATVTLGPSSMGGYLNIALHPDHTPTGPPSGPRIAGILMFLDSAWELGLGDLAAAPDVRAPAPAV